MIAPRFKQNKISRDDDLQALDLAKLAVASAKRRSPGELLPEMTPAELRAVAGAVKTLSWFLESSHRNLRLTMALSAVRDLSDLIVVRHREAEVSA